MSVRNETTRGPGKQNIFLLDFIFSSFNIIIRKFCNETK